MRSLLYVIHTIWRPCSLRSVIPLALPGLILSEAAPDCSNLTVLSDDNYCHKTTIWDQSIWLCDIRFSFFCLENHLIQLTCPILLLLKFTSGWAWVITTWWLCSFSQLISRICFYQIYGRCELIKSIILSFLL